ncbi:acyltransferase family protein [Paracoccus tibetensis]|uniref:Acyltransferase family protein n=1 Tax=Paracoccus tibetensis TaxID=336292 RepID=A0A1G5K2U6_9RHOB|nr:acyltransferase [Paracoccus tibetensis]SCY95002.1 Acyltransferase family protein [Paracoccus tibetensis]
MPEMAAARSLPYYPRLDGLRAVAVLGVFAEHFTYSELIRGWSPGMIGVRTFFVLSGFLITSILLQQRGTASAGDLAGRFFLRRFLRLAPPFYLAIVLAAALGISGMRSDWWVHGLYLSNIQIAIQQQWSGAGHFWTLAVEEQFYLLWFPAVILAPRRWLLPICLACLIAAPLFRSLILLDASPFIDVLLPALYEHVPAILHLTEGPLKLVRSLLWVLISLALAELSWRLVERPLMRRRRDAAEGGPSALLPQRSA